MDHSNVEGAMKEAWQAWYHQSVRASFPPSSDSESPKTGLTTSPRPDEESIDIRKVQAAHVRDRSTAVQPFDTASATESSPTMRPAITISSSTSLLSSKTSFETIEAPKPSYTPDKYTSIVTTIKPLNASSSTLNDGTESDGYSLPYDLAKADELAALTDAHPLPAQVSTKWWCDIRYVWLSAYRKLYILVIIANIVVIGAMTTRPGFTYGGAATATGANLLVAALARHEHVINVLFRIVCLLPYSTPLCIRRQAAKVYSYGGIHSGCGIGAFLWYIIYSALLVNEVGGSGATSTALIATTAATMILLFIIIAMAHPYIRSRWHDQWELSHRYAGWTAIALVWAQTLITVIAAAHQSSSPIALTLLSTPTFWFLLIITSLVIYPWLRLRRRKFTAEKLSNHATRLHFTDRTLPSCKAYRIAHNPLRENHGFATIPNAADEEKGYSIVVSNAGDFTKDLINNPPTHIWSRGAPTTGVMRIATLFRPIVIVATGSGIGPCLSFLNVYGVDYPLRIIWSARSPEETYGREIMRAVLRSDKDAIIIDTKKTGHPDLPALSYALYKRVGAEAVVIISNPKVTKEVVFELESRGVAAFAPIFDS